MKVEEINIGSSHYLLVCCGMVRHPAEDFDYFPLVCQTLSSPRSLSLFSPFSCPCCFFLSSSPCCLCCSSLIWCFSDSPGLACCDLFPSLIDPDSPPPHGGQIKTHADHPQVTVRARGPRGLAMVLLTSECVCVCMDNNRN